MVWPLALRWLGGFILIAIVGLVITGVGETRQIWMIGRFCVSDYDA